jgi:hypothetical protein
MMTSVVILGLWMLVLVAASARIARSSLYG